MHNIKKLWLGYSLLSLLLVGCGEDDNASQKNIAKADNVVSVNTEFSATYFQTIGSDSSPKALPVSYSRSSAVKAVNTDLRYSGQMKVINILNGEEQQFDWPVTQKADGEVVSHRVLTLKPGHYDFTLILSRNEHQYVAKALGQEIIDGKTPEIDFVLLPNLGDTINNIDEVQYVSTLKFAWPAEELAALNQPQFGLSFADQDEQIYTINKDTGIAELIMNVEPGEYQLSMRLYDGDLMVGKSDDQNDSVNFVEGEDAKMDIIPLQADVTLSLSALKDIGTFSFTIPTEIIHEVGSAQELALIVRLSGDNVPVQEKVLTVYDENGIYKASGLFETYGQGTVDAYLAFHKLDEESEQFASVPPFSSCNTSITVEWNQTLGCKLILERESIVSGRILGTLMLSILDQNLQPVLGAKVYVDGKLIGLTGEQYSAGSIKAHLVAGEHTIKVEEGILSAVESIQMEPLAVNNKVLYLKKRSDVGDGNFVQHQTIRFETSEDKYHDSTVLIDVNGDGHLDLVASRRQNSILVYPGDDMGKFKTSPYAVGDQRRTQAIAASDLNADGKPDLIRATSDGDQIFFNDGHGRFKDAGLLLGEGSSQSIAVGDLNNDNHPDIVVGQEYKAPLIYLNRGNGQFSNSQEYLSDHSASSHSSNVVLADVNGNGYLDIIYAGGDKSNMVYLNDGLGHFLDSGQRFGRSNKEKRYNVAAGDVNGDGLPDLIITNMDFHGTEQNYLYLNDGEGEFVESDVFVGQNGNAAAFLDVNSNGFLDLVITGSDKEQHHLYLNNGQGGFTLSSSVNFATDAHTPLFGDIDKDGDLDLILAFSTDTTVYLNQPSFM